MQYLPLGIVGLIGLLALIFGFRQLRKARSIEDTPTSRIRSAPQGYVELTGMTVEDPGLPLHSPLTGEPCLWFEYSIQRRERSGKETTWRTVEKKRSSQAIILEDDSGRCFIHPDRADISSVHHRSWTGSSRRRPGNSGAGFNGGFAGTGIGISIGAGHYRYTQTLIRPGDVLYVLGQFQSLHAPSPEEQAKEHSRQLLNDWKQDYDALVARFDRNGDGEIDMQEWEQARTEAAREALDHARDNYSDEQVHVVSYSPLRSQPFIISNRDPKILARRYRWQASFLLLAAAGSGAGLAWMLNNPGRW